MKAVVKVSHLKTDDALYCRGDIVDFPEERITQLGSSVKRVEPEPSVDEPEGDEPEVVEEVVEPEVIEPPVEEDVKAAPKKRGRSKR